MIFWYQFMVQTWVPFHTYRSLIISCVGNINVCLDHTVALQPSHTFVLSRHWVITNLNALPLQESPSLRCKQGKVHLDYKWKSLFYKSVPNPICVRVRQNEYLAEIIIFICLLTLGRGSLNNEPLLDSLEFGQLNK